MWLRQVSGERRLRAAATRTAGALVATATALTALGAAAPASADVVAPFTKRYDESLYGDFVTIGNTVMGCPAASAEPAARCAAAAGRGGDDGTFVMRRVNTARTTAGYGSSTGRVTIPPGAKVAYARLFFGGNDGTYRAPSGARLARCDISGADARPSPGAPLAAVPVLGVNGGAAARVSVEDLVQDPATTDGPHYYTGEADVTSMFAGVTGTGVPVPVAVGGIWAPDGKGCVAGWSMTVVYKYGAPNAEYAPERRNVYVYGGHVLQRSGSPATTIGVDGFHRAGGGKVRAGVTAYEGGWNTLGDRFLVDGRNITEAHTGSTDDFSLGEGDGAVAPKTVDNLGVDAKAFELPAGTVPPGATSTELTFTTEGDTHVPSALALSVPVPDLEVIKTASPKAAGPGDTLTYTVMVRNTSSLDYPNVRFSDDLTGHLDDAAYNGDVRTDLGHVSYSAPRIGYTGDIPAGRTATVTYSVKLHDPVRGDGKLPNDIAVQSPRSNCAAGSTDPSCGTAPEIEKPQPPAPPALRITNVPERPAVPPCEETGNTVTIADFSARKRTGAAVEWPVTAGSAPVASAGSVTKRGSVYVWKGDVAAHGKVVITQRVKASCTTGEATAITVTAGVPRTNCPKAPRGGDDPCTSVITARREQARPAPPQDSHRQHGSALADTGDSDTLLYGGLAGALCGLGVLAVAAARSRRD
ncbi:DUF11 domain-containing protein [Streptomyces sp. AcE210]|uniref:DUF7927 domain-containing protein n=1 Tax=Streptomyces sp. AcE210 TaxID=2292703 RepID=UPI000E30983F|nr:DUF11 domain-containing protein [Streptomyces sp. AcE210]RFC73660.1 DUF11 domain-containing protein [Streptomyces sp. AcE210]